MQPCDQPWLTLMYEAVLPPLSLLGCLDAPRVWTVPPPHPLLCQLVAEALVSALECVACGLRVGARVWMDGCEKGVDGWA
eukprot:366356-Chlamydomonas_euryale.AAC.2